MHQICQNSITLAADPAAHPRPLAAGNLRALGGGHARPSPSYYPRPSVGARRLGGCNGELLKLQIYEILEHKNLIKANLCQCSEMGNTIIPRDK